MGGHSMGNSMVDSPQNEGFANADAKTQVESAGKKMSEARRRMPFNIVSNMVWLVINIIVNLWYTPFLISRLGVTVFGLVPLANSLSTYLALLTDGFSSAVSRFLQIDLAREDNEAANRTFNTGIAGGFTIFGVLVPLACIASWIAPRVFQVPVGYEKDTQWLVLLTMLAFATTFFAGGFTVSSFSSHRFDLRLYVNLCRLLIQIGSIVLLFAFLPPHLWQVGIGIFLSSIVLLLGHSILWRRLTPQLKINPRLFDRKLVKRLLQFGGWVLVNQAGTQLLLNIDLVLANLIFGAQIAGRYGSVIIFPVFLRTFVGTYQGIVEPIVFMLYARNELKELVQFCRMSVKFTGLLIALPIGLICGLARPLLTIWLGVDYSDLSWLVVALVSHLCINLAIVPLFPIQVATNHVRVPGIFNLIMGLVNVGLAVALAFGSGWGYISIALAGAIVMTIKNTFFTSLYAARVLQLPWHTFLPSMGKGVLGFVVVGSTSYLIETLWHLNSWGMLASTGIILSALYLIAVYLFGANVNERALIKSEIINRLKNKAVTA
jgi:membrane protein EpsK